MAARQNPGENRRYLVPGCRIRAIWTVLPCSWGPRRPVWALIWPFGPNTRNLAIWALIPVIRTWEPIRTRDPNLRANKDPIPDLTPYYPLPVPPLTTLFGTLTPPPVRCAPAGCPHVRAGAHPVPGPVGHLAHIRNDRIWGYPGQLGTSGWPPALLV